jgi:hypothetical protein
MVKQTGSAGGFGRFMDTSVDEVPASQVCVFGSGDAAWVTPSDPKLDRQVVLEEIVRLPEPLRGAQAIEASRNRAKPGEP